MNGLALRVPTPFGSVTDISFVSKSELTADDLNKALKEAANRYLGYTDEPLVSIDFLGDAHSSIVDGGSTKVIGSLVKVMSWYDNEWGYSNRVLDLILHMDAQKPV